MKLEKRSEGSPEEKTEPQKPSNHQKPVFLYILILFSVAFALILLSFFMHQRSNQQVLGELKNNVNALEELQKVQDENVSLKSELQQAEKTVAESEKKRAEAEAKLATASNESLALQALYTLQQQYTAKQYDDCRKTLAKMTELAPFLPERGEKGVFSPAERYAQLRDAVEKAD